MQHMIACRLVRSKTNLVHERSPGQVGNGFQFIIDEQLR